MPSTSGCFEPATVSEALAEPFEKARGLPEEASAVASGDLSVTVSGIAGARYVSGGDARIVERLAA